MKASKIADIVDGEIVLPGGRADGSYAVMLTNLQEVERPRAGFQWALSMEIGQGISARVTQIPLQCAISEDDSLESPIFLTEPRFVYFRDRLFVAERPPKTAAEREEIVLRVKKAVYDEDAELANLRAAVANLEASVQLSRSGPRRLPIPEDVKLVVWARDGGACVRCGSKQNLHFDHIIPVSKGGGHSGANIQILWQACNLQKGDKIASV